VSPCKSGPAAALPREKRFARKSLPRPGRPQPFAADFYVRTHAEHGGIIRIHSAPNAPGAFGTLIVEDKRMTKFCQTIGTIGNAQNPHVFAGKMRASPTSFPRRKLSLPDPAHRTDCPLNIESH
jgi:hypothetical protein